MAQLLENVISSNSSVTKIRKIKERNFDSEGTWELANIEDILDTLFVQIQNDGRWTSVRRDPDALGQKYSPVDAIVTPEGVFCRIMKEDDEGEYVEIQRNEQISIDNFTSIPGVEVASFQEKSPLILNFENSLNKSVHYYPLSSFTDFYNLGDLASFLPLADNPNVDFKIDLLQDQRNYCWTRGLDSFSNGITSYFMGIPLFSEKGAASVQSIKNLLFFKTEDLIYVNTSSDYYLQNSPWKSCWNNCTTSKIDYNYANALDGTKIIPNGTGDVIFSRELTLSESGNYCFSFFIKLDSEDSFNGDNIFRTELNVSLSDSSGDKICDLFLDEDIEKSEPSAFRVGESWKRIVAVFKDITVGNYTLKICWPYWDSRHWENRTKRLNSIEFNFKLRIAGLLFEKNSWVSIYDPEYVNYLEDTTLYDNPDYARLKPMKDKEIKIVAIGEDIENGNEKKQSFNADSYIIIYKRYVEGEDVWDNIGNKCQIGYESGIFEIRTLDGETWTTFSPAPLVAGRGFRPCVWETIVFYYDNSESEEILEVYYPEDTTPRFRWSAKLYDGRITPLEIKTGSFPNSKLSAYLLFGAKPGEDNSEITPMNSVYPAYYKDLLILKNQSLEDPKFKRILTDSLFRLKLEQKRKSREEKEASDISLIADNIQEGCFTLNKLITINDLS